MMKSIGVLFVLALLLPSALRAQSEQAPAFHVLYAFTGGSDGGSPASRLVQDAPGNLYGTTPRGGMGCGPVFKECGIVFKLDPSGKETVLYTFNGGADGGMPAGGLIQDASGNFYGTTSEGGDSGNGTVFRLDMIGNKTVLYSFIGGNDGARPSGALVRDEAGNLYGITILGGEETSCGGSVPGCGTVFKLDPTGKETVLHSFTGGADGAFPYADLALDAAGSLYGTTANGGSGSVGAGNGVVFKIDATGNESVLYTFKGGSDGAQPFGDLYRDKAGNLYGTTYVGGVGNGVVFKLDTAGNETVLHAFTGGADGALPSAGLTGDNSGNLYGTTSEGGNRDGCGCGTVYKLDPTGKETVLYRFTGKNDGSLPAADLFLDGAGNLYGATQLGGSSGKGVVFELGGGVAPDFSLAAASATVSVNDGGKASDTVTIAPQNGSFGNAIQLTCAVTGPAPMPTCALSPSSVTPGAGSVTSTLTVTAPAATVMQFHPSYLQLSKSLYALGLPLMFGIVVVGRSKTKHRWSFVFCGLLLALVVLQMACGGSSSSSGSTTSFPRNYAVAVSGASGAIEHTAQVIVTVQ